MVTSQQYGKRSWGDTGTPLSAATSAPAEAVAVGARRVAAALTGPGAARSRTEWLAVVGECQSLINTLGAVQDAAIAEAARRESGWCEDGTLGESVHGRGRVTLDAADVVAPVIGASHPQAQRRVEQAVRLAARRVPVQAEGRDVPEASGLGGLHEAMAAGHLDGYRAGVISFELEVAPAHVAEAIVAALSGHLGDEASLLRRRTRVLLSRISPDLVRERARRARAATGLRRWVAEPGVDEWHGTFPSEDAATAWAAIDRLAHDLVAAGTCTTIEQARGKALTDLVTGNATVDVQLVLTVPADSTTPHPAAGNITDDSTTPTPPCREPVRLDVTEPAATTITEGADIADLATAVVEASQVLAVTARTITPDAAEPVVTATTPLLDAGLAATAIADPGHAVAGVPISGHDEDLVEVQGSRPSEPLLVRRGWLRDHLPEQPPPPPCEARQATPRSVPCDPHTGARLDPGDDLATDAYRPSAELAALVRARDGRCRFPGCSVAARFCDLDHVRPWPTGRTTATNLLTLCRRHHRIKQRPGWRATLTPDGTTTWTDPTGRIRTTTPRNALRSLVLTADPTQHHRPTDARTCDSTPNPTSTGRTPWSALETHHQIRTEHHPDADHEHPWLPPPHHRCTSSTDLRTAFERRRGRCPVPDLPPF